MTRTLLARIFLGLLLLSKVARAESEYEKALKGERDVLKYKLFPKEGRFEFNIPDVGMIMNQAYVFSYVGHASVNYYWSEKWGISVEGLIAQNSDKNERYCIEHFFNNPKKADLPACLYPEDGSPSAYVAEKDLTSLGANFGPAYTSIRELNQIITLSGVYTPMYGKDLLFLWGTIYLDLFFTIGGGIASSTYYPTETKLKGTDKPSRSTTFTETTDEGLDPCSASVAGICVDDPTWEDKIGVNGRPEPKKQTHTAITLGVGQKIHFKDRFYFKLEIRNYTLLQTEADFDTFFMIWGGLGFRI